MHWILVLCGAFSIAGAACDWDWFMNHHKARFFIRLFGRNGTRAFYVLLGAGLVALGVLFATGVVPMHR